ncbi:3-phosphoglycerate dehydrogenase [Actinoalloteichus sp. AHMU CJ021]|uniref:D-3-phosphoglycerate dehydrogenase n=1 Tax=Actinoalloteichus caeruleus DSM 43889 TaxID=1120930 RepID=A0ABT1JCK3_ACTCY|nr:NAD(P)-dependent oxidoreductase [Actinoalloteichus caeruleus]AUS80768.1 3-phosphoglycerate dehydrogenase [Actinoalloteichus sp. AHMU CJ021]MCP2330168.1 D-3-phosphoglycerate dehydrogenase [Actinoalloteichus caeruleus DSM 43889]
MTVPTAPDDHGGGGPRPTVLVLDPIADSAIRRLREDFTVVVRLRPEPDVLRELVGDAHVVVLRSGVRLPAAVFAAAPSLRLVIRAGVGTDNIDMVAAELAGVRVVNIPNASAQAVAELAFGLLLGVVRRVALADRQVRGGAWRKDDLLGVELGGRTLGIVGVGAIGSRIARIGAGFGMRRLGTVGRPGPRRAAELAELGVVLTELPELLATSDVVCLALPLTEDTRGLIGAAELAMMRRDAVLVNVARAGVVDEDHLVDALRAGRLAGAATDVPAGEGRTLLRELDNVVITPHIGAMTVDTQERIGQRVVELATEEFGGTAPGALPAGAAVTAGGGVPG